MMEKQFELHNLSVKGTAAMNAMSDDFNALAVKLGTEYWQGNPREKAICLNKLEEAFFYAMKAASHRPDYKA